MVKKISCHNFLCSHKFHKIANYFSFEVLKKKIWANFQRIIEHFTQKIVNKFSKIWGWDPRSGKNLFRIPDPGIKKAPDPGSGSATLVVMPKICADSHAKDRRLCIYRIIHDRTVHTSLTKKNHNISCCVEIVLLSPDPDLVQCAVYGVRTPQ